MAANNSIWAITFSLLFFSLILSSTAATSTAITPGHPLLDGHGDTLVSAAGVFKLGFFSPPGTTRRYVGIWYNNIPIQTVVWVANRDTPLNDSSGVLSLTGDGNLSLHGGAATFWSTNTSSVTNPVVQLLDSGNLVVSDGSTNTTEWQSFDHPTDTLLPGMEIGRDPSANIDRRLTSWRSASDPFPGPYTLGISIHVAPEVYQWNGSVPVTRSGPWDGKSWGGSAAISSHQVVVTNHISRGDGAFLSYDMVITSLVSRLVMDGSGWVRQIVWKDQDQRWATFWLSPTTECDQYAHCGGNGLCNSQDTPVCKCLPGFLPNSMDIWNPLARADGCRRRTLLGCREGDGFRNVTAVRLPETENATVDMSKSYEECREGCLSDCSCTAFAFLSGSSGCITWFGDLVDVQQLPEGTGQEFYLRLAESELIASSDPGHLAICYN